MHTQNQLQLKKNIVQYEKSDFKTSLWQIFNSMVPFLLLWYLAYESLSVSYWLTLTFAVLASGFSIRIFILFHDCCHGSFFKNRLANEI
jgi:omega-6 fatty acid desaturase (delta-12 desaturase)